MCGSACVLLRVGAFDCEVAQVAPDDIVENLSATWLSSTDGCVCPRMLAWCSVSKCGQSMKW